MKNVTKLHLENYEQRGVTCSLTQNWKKYVPDLKTGYLDKLRRILATLTIKTVKIWMTTDLQHLGNN